MDEVQLVIPSCRIHAQLSHLIAIQVVAKTSSSLSREKIYAVHNLRLSLKRDTKSDVSECTKIIEKGIY